MIRKILLAVLLAPLVALAQSYPSPTYQNTTTSNLQVNTGISVGPVPSSLVKAINTSQAVSGTTSSNCTSTSLIVYPCVNLFQITADTADASSAPGPVMDGWQFVHNFGGASMNGGRQVLDVIGHFTGPSNPANTLPGYVGIVGELITNFGDNGTAPTIANGRGSFFAMNPVVVANSGAQNLFGIAGEEVNVQCNGCSTAIRYGVSVVNNGANQGSILANDAAFHLGSFNSGGTWHQALNLSSVHGGPPLDTTGCVICTDATNITIQTGIDLHNYTITGNFLNGPSGFVVTGAGAVTVPAGLGVTAGGLTVNAGGAGITGGLTVTGAVSGTGFSNYLASPPAIGGTAANTGAFTTLTSTGGALNGSVGATTPSTGAFTTVSASSTITPSQTAGIVGTTTNNNAQAGSVGEYTSTTNTATSMTTNTGANCTSISLTAGDWDVWGAVSFNAASTTTIQALDVGVSTTSGTLGALGTTAKYISTFSTGPASDVIPTPVVRESLASTTTVFMIGLASFGASTMTCDGFIAARRVR